MAKDPAVNWYFDNWAGGTLGLNRMQKGCYMDLLNAQFQLGHLSLEHVKNILGSDFTQWNVLKVKFEQDEQGNFFNERLAAEIVKREKFREKQSINGGKGGRPKKPKQNPTLNPNETQTKPFYGTETETDISFYEIEIGGMGEKEKELFLIPQMLSVWKQSLPGYPDDETKDYPALNEISEFIRKQEGMSRNITEDGNKQILANWKPLCEFIGTDGFFKKYSLKQVATHIQSIIQSFKNGNRGSKNESGNSVDIQSALNKLNQFTD